MDRIDLGKRSGGNMLGDLLKNYLSRFKVYKSDTLFDTNDFLELLLKRKCPICAKKLYITQNGAGYCKSKKHKRFWITSQKLTQLTK